MNKKTLIAERALELFNSEGIEYVGMRELATSLNTKLGNITYYYPTKEDLITELWTQLSKQNSMLFDEWKITSLSSLMNMLQKNCEHHIQFRCLMLSFTHLVKQYPGIASRYTAIEHHRRNMVKKIFELLSEKKYLRQLSEQERFYLESLLLFIQRFWISESAISYSSLEPAKQIHHYLEMFARSLLPYCTTKGKKDLHENGYAL